MTLFKSWESKFKIQALQIKNIWVEMSQQSVDRKFISITWVFKYKLDDQEFWLNTKHVYVLEMICRKRSKTFMSLFSQLEFFEH